MISDNMTEKETDNSDVEIKVIKKTASLCPECLRIIGAEVFEMGGKVWIRKKCPEHGDFEELYWGDAQMYHRAEKYAKDGKGLDNPNVNKDNPQCPRDCGLCSIHKSHTALGNIALTTRCDLACWYCFFYASRLGYVYEPSLGQIREMMRNLRNEKPVPCNAIQLTGGEPTLREDLIDVIKIAKEEGFDHVQLNTNGIRLSYDKELCRKLRDSGVNTLYLSFDGMTGKSNVKNHWEIPGIFENCREFNLRSVLVPTVIKGVNDHELGDIIKFGVKHIDVVSGVNFQPVSLVGKMPRKDRAKHRITIPDVIRNIEEQTDGMVLKEDFYPVPSVSPITRLIEAITKEPKYELSAHFACGMATYLFIDEKTGKFVPITQFVDVDGFFNYLNEKADEIEAGKSKYVTGLKMLWKIRSFIKKEKQPAGLNMAKLIYGVLAGRGKYDSLLKMHYKSLFIGMMHFQDLYNYDIERVKRCCIHYAMTDGRIIPFCAFNVIPEWYRDKTQKSQGIPIDDWEKQTGKKLKDELYHRDIKKLESNEAYKKTYGK